MTYTYEKKFVLFFDILGFSEIIKNKDCNKIAEILENIQNISFESNYTDILFKADENGMFDIYFEDGDIGHGKIIGNNAKYSFFSDSIAISIDLNDIESTQQILRYCANLQYCLLLKGIIIRGGLCCGDIYHQNNMIFGPALNEAYEIEHSKIEDSFIGVTEDFFESLDAKLLKEDYFQAQGSGKIGTYRLNFLSFFSPSEHHNDPKLSEIKKILAFLKENIKNDKKNRTAELISYIECFSKENLSEAKEDL